MGFYVYILASRRNGTLYTGMTDDLLRRVYEHRTGAVPGFTQQYDVKMLVWYEQHDTRETALIRERQIKKWNRDWKLRLIESLNRDWRDLWDEICVRFWVPAFAGTNGANFRSFPRKRESGCFGCRLW